MNIVYHLLKKFYNEESFKIITMLILNLIVILFQINGISFITANIIKFIGVKDFNNVITYFKLFVFISVIFIILYSCNKMFQNHLLIRLTQWIKQEILKIILISNNENFTDTNFIEFITPITRISVSIYVIFNNIITVFIPTIAFLSIISFFFLYENIGLGLFFLISNALIFYYIYCHWETMLNYKKEHEAQINDNEKYIINLLNNIDKVIYRGQHSNEIDIFTGKTNEGIDKAMNLYNYTNFHIFIINVFIHLIMFISIIYMIYLSMNKKMNTTIVVTFFTILLLYRDKLIGNVQEIPDILEFIGRITYIVEQFKSMLGNNEIYYDKIYNSHKLNFDNIIFKNVSFKYAKSNKYIYNDVNMDIDLNDKIIGITGLSGNGKSTFAKLLLKMYKCNSGEIFIDGVNINDIEPVYLRQNITYVNQNSKLFDKVIIENILYGCNELKTCNINLNEILENYPKIKSLYKNTDIHNNKVGSLGEKLSGGQRQVVNIISGIINPSKILILDEPTNALDPELKREILSLIQNFKKYKKCIFIITHDEDVYSLFDEEFTI